MTPKPVALAQLAALAQLVARKLMKLMALVRLVALKLMKLLALVHLVARKLMAPKPVALRPAVLP